MLLLMPPSTVSQVDVVGGRRFQAIISEDAFRRIKVAAAKADKPLGEIVTALAIEHLAPVDGQAEVPDGE
jgi:hypothetical protein